MDTKSPNATPAAAAVEQNFIVPREDGGFDTVRGIMLAHDVSADEAERIISAREKPPN
jgi:hypothetical protein